MSATLSVRFLSRRLKDLGLFDYVGRMGGSDFSMCDRILSKFNIGRRKIDEMIYEIFFF